MQLKNLFTDEDAVSPVIGVILMVAITVILAAVIGAFVLGIGSNQEKAPQAQMDFSYDGTDVKVTHGGGETVNGDQLSISGAWSGCTVQGGQVSAGGLVVGDTSASDDRCGTSGSGGELTITWTAESGDSSQIFAESTVP